MTSGALLTFTPTFRHDPAVDAWLDRQTPALGALARGWFTRMRACGTDVRELLHDGHPTACVGETAFGYVNVFTSHLNVGFFLGAELPDPAGLLEGTGKRMRHVTIRPGQPVNTAALADLIRLAYADIQARLPS